MTEPLPKRRPRGRPAAMSTEERRATIIDAAETVFLDRGYGATMSDVADAAGMSKKTLYEMYSSKESLFSAVIAQRTRVAVPQLTEEMLRAPLDEVLIDIVGRITRYVLSPKQISMLRLVIGESERSAAVASEFYWEGLHRGSAPLSQLLALKVAEGRLDLDDPVVAAHTLAHMSFGDLQLAMLVGAQTPSPREIESRIAMSVRLFLHGAARVDQHLHESEAPR